MMICELRFEDDGLFFFRQKKEVVQSGPSFFYHPHCLKISQNVAFEIFKHALFDRKLQIFKNSPKLNATFFCDFLSIQNVYVARFARNVMRFFSIIFKHSEVVLALYYYVSVFMEKFKYLYFIWKYTLLTSIWRNNTRPNMSSYLFILKLSILSNLSIFIHIFQFCPYYSIMSISCDVVHFIHCLQSVHILSVE